MDLESLGPSGNPPDGGAAPIVHHLHRIEQTIEAPGYPPARRELRYAVASSGNRHGSATLPCPRQDLLDAAHLVRVEGLRTVLFQDFLDPGVQAPVQREPASGQPLLAALAV